MLLFKRFKRQATYLLFINWHIQIPFRFGNDFDNSFFHLVGVNYHINVDNCHKAVDSSENKLHQSASSMSE